MIITRCIAESWYQLRSPQRKTGLSFRGVPSFADFLFGAEPVILRTAVLAITRKKELESQARNLFVLVNAVHGSVTLK
jgi:hypothetical protein